MSIPKPNQNTIALDNPIKINNNDINLLTYDGREITVALYAEACARAAAATATGGSSAASMKIKEVDYNLHLYLGMAAVIAVNPDYSFEDLERVKGFDILDLANIGSFFIYRRSVEPSAPGDSENSDEATPATSM